MCIFHDIHPPWYLDQCVCRETSLGDNVGWKQAEVVQKWSLEAKWEVGVPRELSSYDLVPLLLSDVGHFHAVWFGWNWDRSLLDPKSSQSRLARFDSSKCQDVQVHHVFRWDFRHFSLPPISRSAGSGFGRWDEGQLRLLCVGHGDLQVGRHILAGGAYNQNYQHPFNSFKHIIQSYINQMTVGTGGSPKNWSVWWCKCNKTLLFTVFSAHTQIAFMLMLREHMPCLFATRGRFLMTFLDTFSSQHIETA